MTRLRLLATIAAAIALLPLAGCGLKNPMENPDFPADTAAAKDATAAPAAAVKVGEGYAIAARGFTPDTMRTQYERQLALAGEPLHHELEQVGPPTAAEIHAQRENRARTTATLIRTQPTRVTRDVVTLQITLDERVVGTGTLTDQQTTNLTTVARGPGGRWLVTAFTAQPQQG